MQSSDLAHGNPSFRFRQGGFTLLEMIIVMVVIAVLGVSVTRFMTSSVSAYLVTAERQRMALSATAASEQMMRSLALALPNSVRVGGGCLEWIPVQVQTFYPGVLPGGAVSSLGVYSSALTQTLTGYAVVYPDAVANLYSPSANGPLTAALATLPIGTDEVTLTLTSPHHFVTESPGRRLYLVSSPESYCASGGSIHHHRGYGFRALMATPPGGSSRTVLLTGLEPGSLGFRYHPASTVAGERVGFRFRMASSDGAWVVEQEVHLRHVP